MNSKARFSYFFRAYSKSAQELQHDLTNAIAAIDNKSGDKPAGDYYFIREVVKKELKRRGK